MTFKIEKNIPAPEKPIRGERAFPFDKMKVGESFCVPMNGRKSWAFVFTAIQSAQAKLNIKLTTRLIDQTTRRIWRTE